jgi:hypothetical protein
VRVWGEIVDGFVSSHTSGQTGGEGVWDGMERLRRVLELVSVVCSVRGGSRMTRESLLPAYFIGLS